MRNLIYLPLEPYAERYTCQLSKARTGWLERRWLEAGQPYIRIEGESLSSEIRTGSVLDAFGRGYWALRQVQDVLKFMQQGHITSEDAIYFDDFWHPGMSAIPYAAELSGVKPKMYAMLHAQSVDEFDFTCRMLPWIRPFEVGIGCILSGIFVTSTELRELCIKAGIGTPQTVHLCGLPYNSEEVQEHFRYCGPKRRQVVFSSRLDWEKQPHFFLKVAEKMAVRDPSVRFVITTSSKALRSNDPAVLPALLKYQDKHDNLEVCVGLTKEQYYGTLQESAVQFNCALQDWVSWTLLEATTCECTPVYPNFRSFPEVLPSAYLYNPTDVSSAVEKILYALDHPMENHRLVYGKFDKSWHRMLQVMHGGRSYASMEDWND